MTDNPSDQNQSQPEESPSHEFSGEFQKAIESYAEAVNADQTEQAD